MNIDRILPLAAALLMLGGCTTNPLLQQPGDAAFGEANRMTMMAQVVNPDPVYDGDMVTSGEHAADAVDRYRNDQVKQPDSIRTTDAGADEGPN